MAFDISRLTSAVNRHLNSISDLSAQIRQASEDAAARAQFSVDLKNAIEANIQSHMPAEGTFPDYAKEIQEAGQQIRDSFSSSAASSLTSTDASSNASSTASTKLSSAITAASTADSYTASSANKDAYSGRLSLDALQELSKSQYFNVNLIQKSLFENTAGSDDDTANQTSKSSQVSAFGSNLSLSDLNENSLLAAELLKSNLTQNMIS